ncbi:hypothetical protein K0U83_04190 [bacterium]|nr:hypothetical protein [bacterium]
MKTTDYQVTTLPKLSHDANEIFKAICYESVNSSWLEQVHLQLDVSPQVFGGYVTDLVKKGLLTVADGEYAGSFELTELGCFIAKWSGWDYEGPFWLPKS